MTTVFVIDNLSFVSGGILFDINVQISQFP